jgi:hypothetical protein
MKSGQGSVTTPSSWTSLDTVARCVFIEIARLYNGNNNGELGISCRRAGKLCNVSKNTADRAIQQLLDRGFLRRTRTAGFGWKAGARQRLSPCYAITHLPVGDALPTKDFVHWTAPQSNVITLPKRAA